MKSKILQVVYFLSNIEIKNTFNHVIRLKVGYSLKIVCIII